MIFYKDFFPQYSENLKLIFILKQEEKVIPVSFLPQADFKALSVFSESTIVGVLWGMNGDLAEPVLSKLHRMVKEVHCGFEDKNMGKKGQIFSLIWCVVSYPTWTLRAASFSSQSFVSASAGYATVSLQNLLMDSGFCLSPAALCVVWCKL